MKSTITNTQKDTTKKDVSFVEDIDHITQMVDDYFDGLHHADTDKLRGIFHPDVVLKAPGLRRSLEQWLQNIETREVPSEQTTAKDYRLMSIDIVGQQALVKLSCPLLGKNFIDFLGLLKEQGHWLIVNKMYAEPDVS